MEDSRRRFKTPRARARTFPRTQDALLKRCVFASVISFWNSEWKRRKVLCNASEMFAEASLISIAIPEGIWIGKTRANRARGGLEERRTDGMIYKEALSKRVRSSSLV